VRVVCPASGRLVLLVAVHPTSALLLVVPGSGVLNLVVPGHLVLDLVLGAVVGLVVDVLVREVIIGLRGIGRRTAALGQVAQGAFRPARHAIGQRLDLAGGDGECGALSRLQEATAHLVDQSRQFGRRVQDFLALPE
jgi:membrane protein required for beta-lactamase induction